MLRPFLFALLLPLASAGAEPTVGKSAPPAWVALPEYEIPTTIDSSLGSVRYIVVDFQTNLEQAADYKHFATQINTSAGVEEYAQLSVDFQPEYQTLTWHSLDVIRDGETQDRLPAVEFELIRQEKGLDRQLYDGEITAHAILSDIRPGDTIAYSYTVTGENPIFGGKKHSFLRTEFSSPIDYHRCRILWDASVRTLQWKQNEVAPAQLIHTEKSAGSLDTLLAEKRNSPGIEAESGVPSSFPIYPYLEISDYASWQDFGKWTENIYLKGEPLPADILAICEEIKARNLPPDESALAILRWVQENVRYLGSFMGEHTHAPYSLSQIAARRFGDCKDKAMLTTAMLRHLGFDAAPALVNTYEREAISAYLPGHRNFDHLIVHLKLAEKDYWLDPTRTFQRGTLADSYSTAYGFAFVIRQGATALTPVAPAGFALSKTSITESFDIPDMSGNATMHVHTIATGMDADHLRRTFSTDSLSDIEETYREYYEKDYPGITVAAPITFSDDEKQNRIVITESYALTALWEKDEGDEEDQLHAWFYARFVSADAEVPAETERKLPYGLSFPTHHIHTLEITPPEGWDLPEDGHSRHLPALDYDFTISTTANGTAIIRYEHRTLADRVLPQDFPAYREAMKLMSDDIYYYLGTPIVVTKSGNEVVKSYAFVTGFLMLGLLAGIITCGLLWFWDPAPRAADPSAPSLSGIGGWLIIVIFGCLLMPFANLYELSTFYTTIDADSFTLFSGFDNQGMLQIAYAIGSAAAGFHFCASILLLFLIFRKRTSFPFAFILLEIAILITDTTFITVQNHALDSDFSGDDISLISQTLISILIWGSYMLLSQRIRQTFIRRRKPLPPARSIALQSDTPPRLPQ